MWVWRDRRAAMSPVPLAEVSTRCGEGASSWATMASWRRRARCEGGRYSSLIKPCQVGCLTLPLLAQELSLDEKSVRKSELLEAFTAGEDSHGTCLKDRPKRESTRKKAAPVPRMSIQRGNEWGHLRAGGCAAAMAIGSQKFVAPHSLPPPGPTDVTI